MPPTAVSGATASTRSTATVSVKERWTQWDHLCEGSAGPGPHRVRISPYDPEHRVWVINETFNQIYVFSNDGSKLLKTLGEKNVPGNDGTHFAKPQDVAFLPDGRILVADGLDNHRVMILDRDANYISRVRRASAKGPASSTACTPSQSDRADMIFALDRSGGRINVFRTTADPAKVEFVEAFDGFSLPLDLIVNDDSLWVTDLSPLRFTKLDFKGNHLYTWIGAERSAGRLSRGAHDHGRLERQSLRRRQSVRAHAEVRAEARSGPGVAHRRAVGRPLTAGPVGSNSRVQPISSIQ